MDIQLQYIKEYELDTIMEYLGYDYDNIKSSKSSKKYKDNQGNIFIVKDNKYFNVLDYNDNGTVIDFIQNHIINEKNFYKVKKWFNDNIENIENMEYNGIVKKKYKNKESITPERKEKERKKEVSISFSLLYQKILKNKILNKKNIRKIDIDIFNYLIDKEIIKYYYKYKLLKIPLYQDNNMVGILNINIENYSKFLEKGSNKGIFLFGNKNNNKYILLFESFLDSLSYLQLLSIKYNISYENIIDKCIFISTNGSISKNNINDIKNIFNNSNTTENIVLCFDNDEIGKKYDELIKTIIPKNIEYYINKSIEKDFNDDLQQYYNKQYKKEYISNVIDIYSFK